MYSVVDYAYDTAAGRGHVGRHIGKSEAELWERIHAEGLMEVSTFSNIEEAVKCIDQALMARSESIHAWLRASRYQMLRIVAPLTTPAGLVVTRSPRATQPGLTIKVVLCRDDSRTPPFYVETAFLLR